MSTYTITRGKRTKIVCDGEPIDIRSASILPPPRHDCGKPSEASLNIAFTILSNCCVKIEDEAEHLSADFVLEFGLDKNTQRLCIDSDAVKQFVERKARALVDALNSVQHMTPLP